MRTASLAALTFCATLAILFVGLYAWLGTQQLDPVPLPLPAHEAELPSAPAEAVYLPDSGPAPGMFSGCWVKVTGGWRPAGPEDTNTECH